MENYIRKVCPFCKTDIKEGDLTKVCPSCGIPHHESCWEENKGCTTFGCDQQQYEEQGTNPTVVCSNCGEMLGDEQQFCPNCGTAKNVQKENICGRCGMELQEGQEFCPNCGQKAGVQIDENLSLAVDQFNANVENNKKKKKSKALPIIIAIALIVCIGVGFIVSNILEAKKAEETKKAKEEYIATVEEYYELSITAGVNLEDIADTVQRYWYENIWYDRHGYDINDAIYYALVDRSDEINQAETYDAKLRELYAKIKNVPKKIKGKDLEEVEELRDAVKELHNVYTDFYSLATDPSGSYNSYSADNSSTTNEFISCYHALENLLK
ncbi:MAG: zinc-ribbon domain-containing protein [Ruminococcaceae bacterium]|nr:zinc-ribbon domain-containing protein [Oscillospiraceae bacterium]